MKSSMESSRGHRPPGSRPGNPSDNPLSFVQRQAWDREQRRAEWEPPTIVLDGFRLLGPLDQEALRRSLEGLLIRHDILRSRFVASGGEPTQLPAPVVVLSLPVFDLSPYRGAELEQQLQAQVREEGLRRFDLEEGHLLHLKLIRVAPEEHLLVVAAHRLILDSESMAVLGRELAAFYRHFRLGEPLELAPVTVPFGEFARREREWLDEAELERMRAFWDRELAGAERLDMLTTNSRRPGLAYVRKRVRWALPEGPTRDLEALARSCGVSLQAVAVTLFTILLRSHTLEDDLSIAAHSPRTHRADEPLLGPLSYPLILRTDLSGDPRLGDLVARTAEVAERVYAHYVLPYQEMIDAGVKIQFDPDAFVPTVAAGLEIHPHPFDVGSSVFDLSFEIGRDDEGLVGHFDFDSGLFFDTTVRRIGHHLSCLIHSALADPGRRLSELALFDQRERHQILAEWNPAPVPYDRDGAVHRVFEEQVRRRPSATAVTCSGQALSYAELDARANRLAHHLRSLGVVRGSRVGLAVNRSIPMVVGILGILKAGGAYVPLDPSYPRERLRFMAESCDLRLLVTLGRAAETFSDTGLEMVRLDRHREAIAAHPATTPDVPRGGDDAVYVMFTSGSTGRPKAIVIPHRGVLRLLTGVDYVELDDEQVFLQLAPVSFDASTLEIWGALLFGGRLVLYPGNQPSLAELARFLDRESITVLWLTAALFDQMVASHADSLARVPQLLAGGDVLSPDRVRQMLDRPGARVVNGYGPTESTTFACCYRMSRRFQVRSAVSIGLPIANTRVYLLDPLLHPVPIGAPAQLMIGGDGLAWGYLGNPALTARTFIPDEISGRPGERLYATGDLARHLNDGRIEFLGRIDSQVKIRGFRIEPGEIESTLLSHPLVEDCAVMAHDFGPADKRLVAWVVSTDREESAAVLPGYLEGLLPYYMVPSAFVHLDRLPVTPNGKLDRKALPPPTADEMVVESRESVAPRTAVEEMLLDLFTDLLSLQSIGVFDDFFELGGHSLLVTRLVARVRELFEVELPLATVFECSTVAKLAQALEEAVQGRRIPPLVPQPREGEIPLAFVQEQIWFLTALAPSSTVYNFQMTLRLEGPLEVPWLERCFDEVVRRHEVLRTTFHERDGRPYQVVHEPFSTPLPVVDLSRLDDREARAEEIVRREVRKAFDVEKLPLMRWLLLRLAPESHVLLDVEHHFVHDGWSIAVLLREMREIYGAGVGGRAPELPELPVQYADYALWQRRWLRGETLDDHLDYWTEQLAGSPSVLSLPTDRPRPRVQTFRGTEYRQILPTALYEEVRALAKSNRATLFMTLLAAFSTLLRRFTGQEELCLGSGFANRRVQELEPLMGMMVNTVVLRVDVSGDPSFHELLQRVRKTVLEAHAHQDVPLRKIVQRLQPDRDLSRYPLFQGMFSFHDSAVPELIFGEARGTLLERTNGTSKSDLNTIVIPRGEQFAGQRANQFDATCVVRWEYSTEIFDRTTILRMGRNLEVLLEALVRNAGHRLSELWLTSRVERHQMLMEWNPVSGLAPLGGAGSYDRDRAVHRIFEERAERHPEATAVTCGDRRRSYAELDRDANRLAHYLRSRGVGRGSLVGLAVERSIELVVGVLGILKAGGAYVPLDPAYPRERLRFMAEACELELLVTESSLAEGFAFGSLERVVLDRDRDAIGERPATAPAIPCGGGDPVYVMFTSGSTGRPKGITIPHRGVSRLLIDVDYLELGRDETFLQLAPVSFDASTLEIWGALLSGARLALYPDATPSLDGLAAFLDGETVSVLWLTAALFDQMVAYHPESLRRVRQLLAGGDVLSPDRVRAMLGRPGARVVNGYGPTESTTFTCCHPMSRPEEVGHAVSIGRPIAHTRVYLLDRQLAPTPLGAPGQLMIGGDGLAQGYVGQPALTARAFLPDPVSGRAGERLYATGDLARYLADGRIEFLGRLDSQVKIRGFRIEPGEIESTLLSHPEVRECVVMPRDFAEGDKRLVAWVVLGDGAGEHDEASAALSEHLAGLLPEYMIPSVFIFLDRLPVTPNGKLDRKALPAPSRAPGTAGGGEHVSPHTATESMLAELWSELLGVEPVGVHDDFFDLGGHSLLATQMQSRIRQKLDVELSLQDVFEASELAVLAARIDAAIDARADAPGDAAGELALSPLDDDPGEIDLEGLSEAEAQALLDAMGDDP